MKISIITVTYNSAKTLEHTIQSVIDQTYKEIEYIIIDGASSDETLNIISKYNTHINLFISEPDKGIYDAMNKGIKIATGEIVGILNSDDLFYDKRTLEKVINEFDKEDISCVYGNIVYFKNNVENVVRIWRTKPYSDDFFESGEVPPHPALFVRKKVYDEIGLYKTNFKIAADQEFMIRMLKMHKYISKYIDEYLVKMRVGGKSTQGLRSYIISTGEIRKAWNSNGLSYPLYLYFIRPFKKILQLIKHV